MTDPTAVTHASGPHAGKPVGRSGKPNQRPADHPDGPWPPDDPTVLTQVRAELDLARASTAVAERERDDGRRRLAEAEEAIELYDRDRRQEWVAALRDGANRLLEPRGWSSAADALRDRACVIESGVLTPWADQPEQATSPDPTPRGRVVARLDPAEADGTWPFASATPAQPAGEAPAAAGPHPDTPDRAGGAELDLDAIEARAEGAAPGPWMVIDPNEGTGVPPGWQVVNDAFLNPPGDDEDHAWVAVELHTGDQADAEFIAHAREDIPALAAEVRRLRGLVSPSAGWVLDVARRWRAHRHDFGPQAAAEYVAAGDALAAAVDALDADQPAEQFEAVRDHANQRIQATATNQTGLLAGLKVGEPARERAAAPEPDSGPGWHRATVALTTRELREIGEETKAVEIDALLADRDQQAQVAANLFSLAERRYLALERAITERDAARAELAEVTAQRDKWRTEAQECHRLQGNVAHGQWAVGGESDPALRAEREVRGRRPVEQAVAQLQVGQRHPAPGRRTDRRSQLPAGVVAQAGVPHLPHPRQLVEGGQRLLDRYPRIRLVRQVEELAVSNRVMPCSRAASMSANAVSRSSPRPNSSGAEPTPPKFPHPSASTETRRDVSPSNRYRTPRILGEAQRAGARASTAWPSACQPGPISSDSPPQRIFSCPPECSASW